MTQDRISELLLPFLANSPLSDSQLTGIASYIQLLMKWNDHINLTAVRDPEKIVTRHFGESLFAAKHLFPALVADQSVIDVGSGAGFPGIPLKIWNPALDLTLLESNHRKAVFLREVIRALQLTGVQVLADRAEQFSQQASLVTLRAVERFERVLPFARRLVADEGRIALLIGDAQISVAKSVLSDLRWEDPLPLPRSQNRILLVGHPA